MTAYRIGLGFQGLLLASTRIGADPDLELRIEKAEAVPIVNSGGYIDASIHAFTVQVPRLQPRTKANFSLWTANGDNIRACKHEVTWTSQRKAVMSAFLREVPLVTQVSADEALMAEAKGSALFIPGYVATDEIRVPIAFVTETEKKSINLMRALYKRFESARSRAFSVLPACDAPVYTAEDTGGSLYHFARIPPGSTGNIPSRVSGPTPLPGGGFEIKGIVAPPKEYVCEQPR